MMRIALAADHGGFVLKNSIARHLTGTGREILDFGTNSADPVDYPDFARTVARAVLEGRAERGIVVCGSGVGACVAANKVPGIRAGLCHDTFSARQGVEDDDMNIICLGARVIGPELAKEIVEAFLKARFSGLERHVRRVGKIAALEKEYRSDAG